MKEKSSAQVREFQSKLTAYSTIAGAALLAAPTAEAAVQNITSIGGGTTISFPTTTDGSNPAVTLNFTAGPFHGVLFGLNVSTAGVHGGVPAIIGNLACQGTSYGAAALRLAKGSAFAGKVFTGGTSNRKNLGTDVSNGGRLFRGSFAAPNQTGYIGFKTGSYYGWLKVKVGTSATNHWADRITLVSNGNGVFGAFDKISDTSADNFTVGTTVDAVPEPSSEALGGLSLLALGAAGVRELRRRRATAK